MRLRSLSLLVVLLGVIDLDASQSMFVDWKPIFEEAQVDIENVDPGTLRFVWLDHPPLPDDFALSAEVVRLNELFTKYGLQIGPNESNLHFFRVQTDGYYAIYRKSNSVWDSEPLAWGKSDAIRKGWERNELVLFVENGTVRFTVNEEDLATLHIEISEPIRLGLVAENSSGNAASIGARFSNIAVWKKSSFNRLPESPKPPPDIRIEDVDGQSTHERITLKNHSEYDIDLTGWYIEVNRQGVFNTDRYEFPTICLFPSQATLTIHTGPGSSSVISTSCNQSKIDLIGDSGFFIPNEQFQITLFDPEGSIISTYFFPRQNSENPTIHVVRMITDGDTNYFEPAFLRIRIGDSVQWNNTNGVHSTRTYSMDNQQGRGIPYGAMGWYSELLTDDDATFSFTFTQEGTYAYFCLPHESLGMVGLVVVGDEPASLSQEFLEGMQFDTARQELLRLIGENSTRQEVNPIVTIETTMGTFKIKLYSDLTPITVGNFLNLVQQKFYDGLIFHRVIYEVTPSDGRPPFKFVIQGGDPFCTNGDENCGEGGPGWKIPLEVVPQLRHSEAGMVAMARSEDPDSAGSQFYITLGPLEFLDDRYAVFGKVIDGLDVVMAIGQVPTNDNDRPLENVVMEQVYFER